MPTPIKLIEHQQLDGQDIEKIKNLNLAFQQTDYLKEPKYLGIYDYCASYYIGASWLVKNELAVIVTPKMKNIDFVTMFLEALEIDAKNESDYFAQCYGIQFDEPTIETDEQLNQLTPLLVLHFVSLLERLVKRGLKKDYVIREENLKTKVKGRFLFTKHLQKNVFQQRSDRVFCQFQEYTDDIPENRLLKKALLFADRIINNFASLKAQSSYFEIQSRLSKLKNRLDGISDEIEPYQVQKISTNKLFKEYKEAIRVAKMLLRRYDYSISEASEEQHSTPPFWIDMSRLYEMWVFSKLQQHAIHKIHFQEKGFYGRQVADFVIPLERLILDAKYKPNYANNNFVDIDDIRELSGNARDESLLPNLDESYSPRCIILYPGDYDELKYEEEALFDSQGIKIPHYRNFYKISVKLPVITQKMPQASPTAFL